MRSVQPTIDTPAAKANSCRLTIARVVEIKARLVDRFQAQGIPKEIIREALAAAEAEAWLCGFPYLFLPDLAEEFLRHLLQKRSSIHPGYAQAA